MVCGWVQGHLPDWPSDAADICVRLRRVCRSVVDAARLVLDDAAALEGAAEGDLVGVLEVAADGQAGGEAGDPQISSCTSSRDR